MDRGYCFQSNPKRVKHCCSAKSNLKLNTTRTQKENETDKWVEQPNYRGNEVDWQNSTSLNQWYPDKLYLLNISSNSSESQDLKKKKSAVSHEWTKFQQEELNKAFIALCQTVEEKVNTNKKGGKKSAHKNHLLSYSQSLRWHSLNRLTAAIWRCVETGDYSRTFQVEKWQIIC